MRLTSIRQFVVGAVLATAIGLGGAAGVLAQDAVDVTGQPSHIHVGTCAELDPNPVAPLSNLLPMGVNPDDDADDMETPETLGVLTNGPVSYAESDDVDFAWDDMLGTSHAIVVHESEENIQNYIACGNIGGVVFDNDDDMTMVVGLQSMNDSGFTGIAIFTEDDDGEVDVEVYLSGMPAEETPDTSATPEG